MHQPYRRSTTTPKTTDVKSVIFREQAFSQSVRFTICRESTKLLIVTTWLSVANCPLKIRLRSTWSVEYLKYFLAQSRFSPIICLLATEIIIEYNHSYNLDIINKPVLNCRNLWYLFLFHCTSQKPLNEIHPKINLSYAAPEVSWPESAHSLSMKLKTWNICKVKICHKRLKNSKRKLHVLVLLSHFLCKSDFGFYSSDWFTSFWFYLGRTKGTSLCFVRLKSWRR